MLPRSLILYDMLEVLFAFIEAGEKPHEVWKVFLSFQVVKMGNF